MSFVDRTLDAVAVRVHVRVDAASVAKSNSTKFCVGLDAFSTLSNMVFEISNSPILGMVQWI